MMTLDSGTRSSLNDASGKVSWTMVISGIITGLKEKTGADTPKYVQVTDIAIPDFVEWKQCWRWDWDPNLSRHGAERWAEHRHCM